MPDRAPEDLRESTDARERRHPRWEVGCAPVDGMMERPSGEAGFQLVLWVEAGSRRVLAARFVRPGEEDRAVADLMVEATRSPRQGNPRHPARIVVRDENLLEPLREQADRLGIEVSLTDQLSDWDRVVGEFGAFLAAHWPGRSYLAGRGVTPERVDYLFEAAAAFYAAAPWRDLPEVPLELQLAERRRPFYLVVLGQERVVQGLSLHLSRGSAVKATSRGTHPGFVGDAIALTFEREDSVPPPMREERRAHRWPLAGPAAFPLPYRRLRTGSMREPTVLEVTYLTLALQAVTEMTRRRSAPAGVARRVETVQLQGRLGDSIARIIIPAPFVSTGPEGPGPAPRAG